VRKFAHNRKILIEKSVLYNVIHSSIFYMRDKNLICHHLKTKESA